MVKKKFHDSVFYKINPISGKHHMMFFVAIAIVICAAVCVMPVVAAGEHDHDEWTAWTTTDSLPTIAGHYYLDTDVTLSSDWLVPTGDETHLCLNDHIINLGTKIKIRVNNGANLSLYDCPMTERRFTSTDDLWALDPSGDERLTGGLITGGRDFVTSTNYGEGGGAVFVAGGGTFIMYDGNIVGNNARCGGGVHVSHEGNNGGKFTIYGGSIVGNKVLSGTKSEWDKGTGGGVESSSNIMMYGGEIRNNTAEERGGGLSIWKQNPASSFTMYDGKISGNKAISSNAGGILADSNTEVTLRGGEISENILASNSGSGAGVYFNGYRMTVSGDVVIKGSTKSGVANNIFLTSGKIITVDDNIGLGNKSAIFVNNNVNVATTNSLSSAVRFHSDSNSNKVLSLSGNTVSFKDASIPSPSSFSPSSDHASKHPEYGDVTWYEWDDGSVTPPNANYYVLTNDITLNDIWTVTAGTTYLCLNDNVLDLNGNYITVPYNANLVICDGDSGTSKNFRVDSSDHNLWIYDSLGSEIVTGGVITKGIHNTGNSRGGAISVSGGLVLDGGNIVGNKADISGGAVSVEDGGSFTMNSGTLQGNTARWGGGAVEVDESFNLNGGLISNNNVWVIDPLYDGKGGGVCIAEIGSATISGGEISNNNVVKGLGGGVYFEGVALNIGGLVNIDENHASEKANNVHLVNSTSIHLRDLQSGSNIGVNTSANPELAKVLIAGNAKKSDASSFKPDDDKGGKIKIYFEDSEIYMAGESLLPDFQPESHEGHDDPSVEWMSWKHSQSGPTLSGYYVLENDITLDEDHTWTIPSNGEIYLCLNGHVLNINSNHIEVSDNSKLIIDDCKYGNVSHMHNFTMEPIIIDWYRQESPKGATTEYYDKAWKWNPSLEDSTYNVTGGLITGGNLTSTDGKSKNGGAINVSKNGNLTMLAGNIAGNYVGQKEDLGGAGGAIYVQGEFVMVNGTIIGNIAGAGGGGVDVGGLNDGKTVGNFTMYNGTITKNHSPRYGGGITLWRGKLTLYDGIISDNNATIDGGGIYVEYSNVIIKNATIFNNSANFGGGMCIYQKGVVDIYGCNITQNYAKSYGGGISPFAKVDDNPNLYGTVYFHEESPIFISGNKKWNDSKGDYDNCNFYIAEGHITNIIAGDVLSAGSYIGVKPDPKLTTLIEIPVANTTRYENEIYFHADLEGDFEPFFDGDAQKIYLHSKSEVDGNFTRCEGHHLNHTELGEDIKWYDWNGTGNLMPRHSGYYVMTRDITLTDEMLDYHDPELGGNYDVWNITGEVIHICLNGHVLNLNNSRIRVSSKFIINDCNHDNGVHYFKTEDDGMWNLSDESDYHDIVYGGVITGNTKRVNTYANGPEIKEHGGAIRTVNGSVLFKNGTIVGNRAAVGGGIYVQGGNLTMVNGTIAGNAATDSGGGVEIKDLGRFEMRGGAVKNNTVLTAENGILQKGGGVCLGVNLHDDLVYFIMSGGVIKNNKVGTPANPGFGSGVFVDSRGEISMSGDATVDRSNEFYLSNISQPVQIFGDTFTGGILNINGTVYNKTGHAMYTKIIQVTDESFAHGINASGILRQFDVGDVPKSLGAVLKADSDETNKFILVDYEEPVDPDYYVKINQNADNATITLEGMDKTEDDIYPVTVGTDVRIITHLANPRYVFCNYTVKKETSEEIVETHNVSRNETYSIRNFTMEPDNIVVNATFGLRGDADYNGVVDIVDAACVGVHIIRDEDNHLITPDTNGYFCADVNSNNDIDVIDLYEINRYLVGIITYPGEEMITNPFEHPEAEQNQNELQENG